MVARRNSPYVEAGDPKAHDVVVLVHGFPLGTGMWMPQLTAFPGWRILAPSLPGFDEGDPLSYASMDAYAGHVLALLDVLKIRRVAVVGLSMGGYVTFALLRHSPHRIRGAVLADTRAASDSDDAKVARRKMLEVLSREGPAGVAAAMMPKLLGKTSQEQRPELADELRQMIERQTPKAVETSLRAIMERPDARPELARIACPTLVVVGNEDTLTPPEESLEMQAGIPGSALVRIPDAGHMSNMENPKDFNASVEKFLSTLSRGSQLAT